VIELSVVRSGRKATRYLSILKMERRKIAPGMIQFEIDRGRGIVFRASRFGILKRKIGLLKFPTRGSSSTGENRGVVSEKTEARRVESPEPEGRGSEARGRGVGRRQR
jgi:hypothetical protein